VTRREARRDVTHVLSKLTLPVHIALLPPPHLINSSQNNSDFSCIQMGASDDSQNAPSGSGDAPVDDEKPMEEYSAESRTYHAYFDEVSTSAYNHQKYLLTA
jgi:hypothetical protein